MVDFDRLRAIFIRIIDIHQTDGLSGLSPIEQTAFLVWCYPGAVDNGGHASFYYNSYGQYAPETVQALIDVGAPEQAAILKRTIDLFPASYVSSDADIRNEALTSLSDEAHEQMSKMDDEFYIRDDDLYEILYRFCEREGLISPPQ